MSSPRLLAGNFQNVLKLVRAHRAAERVLDRLEPAFVRKLEDSPALSWIEAQDFLPLQRAIHAELSTEEFHAFWMRNGAGMLQHPLLRGPVRFVMDLTGIQAKSIVKSMQHSWLLFSKDAGLFRAEHVSSPDKMVVVWEEIPPVLAVEPGFTGTFAPSFSAVFELLRRPTQVRLEMEPAAGRGVFTFEWSTR